MISIKQLLAALGLEGSFDRVKLVRHVDHPLKSLQTMVKEGEFDFYQGEQTRKKRPFHGCDFIVSFFATPEGNTEFHGVYRVLGSRDFTQEDHVRAPGFLKVPLTEWSQRIWYDLEPRHEFDDLRGRLRVRWRAPLAWVQRRDLEVDEILPPGRVTSFPGYQNVILSWEQLRRIFDHPDSHPDWVSALKFTAAIYRITDLSTGSIYIGSAYGRSGLWNRWKDYARNGRGGNVKLESLDPGNFQWSIVRTLSGVMSQAEVIQIEHLEMRKHGSRATGLNS
ncbi:GIY-YIG nuclease family protein [Haloferula sargassicola]|uniref:GIY-YIG domain-containing protein n=1 Tax=Haloferula sargassicola TaxID=490096 RepID=A0ABP9UTV5_9BACT